MTRLIAKWTYKNSEAEAREESFGVNDKFGREIGTRVSICEIEQQVKEYTCDIYKEGFFRPVKFNGANFFIVNVQPTRNGESYQKSTESYFDSIDAAKLHAGKSIKSSRNRAFKKVSA